MLCENYKGPFTLAIYFCCDFQCDFLLTDVKEWIINNECSEYMFLHLNIRVWFTRSHPSKGVAKIALEIVAKVASVTINFGGAVVSRDGPIVLEKSQKVAR